MNKTLVILMVLVAFGWTALAAGVLAVFAGDPSASMRGHGHVQPAAPATLEGPLLSNGCEQATDASVPCSA